MKKKKTQVNNILLNKSQVIDLFMPLHKVICINSYFDDNEKLYYDYLPKQWGEYTINNVYYRNNRIVGISLLELPNYVYNNQELMFSRSRFELSMFDMIYIFNN